jgi:uncharacterized protein YukE
MAGEQYSNELEQTFNSLPGWVQSPLRPIYEKMDEGLKWVAGNPDDLIGAGRSYVTLGSHLKSLSQQQKGDRAKLPGHWSGDAFEAFSSKMEEIEGKIDKLGDATGKTNEVLEAGANACVEGANMIVEIIISALSWLLAEAAINAVLTVLTFGADAVAWLAEAIAKMLQCLADILSVVEKVAECL